MKPLGLASARVLLPSSLFRPRFGAAFLLLGWLLGSNGLAQAPVFGSFPTSQTTYVIAKGSVNNVFTNIPAQNTTLMFLGSDPATIAAKSNLGITWNTLATVGSVSNWRFNSVSPTNANVFTLALVASNATSKLTATQTVTITVVPPDPSVLPGLVPGSDTVAVPLSPNKHIVTNLPTTNLPTSVGFGVGTTWDDSSALSDVVVSPDNNPPAWRVNFSFFPKKVGTYLVPVLLTNENTGWSNSNNITVIVTPPTDVPDFTNCPSSVTNILSTNQQTANLGGFTNVAPTNCNVLIVSQTPPDAVSTYGITAGVDQVAGVGQLTYTPGIVPTNVVLGLVVSNTVTGISGPTNTVTLNFVPLKPLEVRVRNNTGVPDAQVQIMQVDTGADAFPNNVYFVTNGIQQMGNGISTNFNALPAGTDVNGPYRTLYISNSVSGTLWFCLSNVPYNKDIGSGGNPAVVNTKWSGLPFGNVELAYFGSGYDTVDVTAINQLGIPMKLAMMTNPPAPVALPDGVRGFTNTVQASNILVSGLQVPGSPWFGPAPNTNLITLVGPSSAAAGGLNMSAGGNTNVPGPGPAPGSLHLGWPGFTFPPMSAYVNKVAVEQTNGTWPQPTQIAKTVGDPQSDNVFTFSGTLVFTTNTNTGDPSYLTPVPVLTNVSIFVTNSKTSFSTNLTGLWVQYTPDNGSPGQAWFSSYIYSAPASFTNPVGTYQPDLQEGYVQFGPSGAAWFAANVAGSGKWSANVLDSFLNEIAFGFAGGFVHSPVMGWTNGWVFTNGGNTILGNTNVGAPNTVIGTMVSSNWWNQTNLYSQLQPNSPALSPSNKITWYSSYGNNLFRSAPDVYNHPISDRMKYIKFQPGLGLGPANLDTNVWLEITLWSPPSSSGSASAPAITSSTNVTNAYCTAGAPAPISYQVTAVNTNGGGIYVGSLPDGLTYNPATQMITGALKTNVSGYINIGLMAYNSNSASIAQLPIYLVASVAPEGWATNKITLDRGEAYLAPSNPGTPAYPSAIQQISVSNNSVSMLGTPQDCFFYATNGSLPRGIYLTNLAVGNVVYGFFYGVPVDFQTGVTLDLVAKNPVGSSTNVVTITNAGQGSALQAGVTNAPAYLGAASLTVTSGQFTNLVLNYSNSPAYFTNDPSTPLPPGLSFQVVLDPLVLQGQTATNPFVVSLAGTPIGTPGTSTNINIVAVNAYTPDNSNWLTGTNTNTITIHFASSSPSYLSYSGWVGAWALPPAISGSTADPDNDGFDNSEEYAFGGNPTNPTPYLLTISGSNISYLGLTNATNYTVQNTTNLSTGPWTNYLVTPTNSSDQANIPLPAYYQRKQLTVPLTPGTNNFYRVIFTNQ